MVSVLKNNKIRNLLSNVCVAVFTSSAFGEDEGRGGDDD